MLQSIRDGSKSWGAKIIIGLMVAAMALFGVESLFGIFGSDPDEVASVNGEPIMRQQVELEVQRALRSGQVPPEQERALRNDMLDQLIVDELLRQYADDGRLYVSDDQLDEMIVNLPEFQNADGHFSADMFRNRLASAGYTPMSFRQMLRVDITRQQLQQGLAFSDFTLPSEQERLAELQRQQREIRYTILDGADVAAEQSPTDEQLQVYYADNEADFMRPEQVRVEYVLLDRERMAEGIAVDDDELMAAYREENQNADRRLSHIMVTYGTERTREEAEARVEQIVDELDAGEDFATAAQRYSDDLVSAEQGGDLGVTGRGIFDAPFDEAAFALLEGEVSAPVEMNDAFHIIRADEVLAPSFEQQREVLRQQAALSQVDGEFNQQVQRLIDESFAAEDLQSVADDLGLELHQTDWLGRDEGDDVLSEPGVMAEAFSPEVLGEGYNSEVIELGDDRRLVLRVTEHRDATLLPLDEVRDEVVARVQAQLGLDALREQAQAQLSELRSGESVDIDWVGPVSVTRQNAATVPESIAQEAFRLARPAEGESRFGMADVPQGVAIIAVDDVTTGEVDDELESFVARMAEQLRAQAVVQGLVDDLRSDADIER